MGPKPLSWADIVEEEEENISKEDTPLWAQGTLFNIKEPKHGEPKPEEPKPKELECEKQSWAQVVARNMFNIEEPKHGEPGPIEPKHEEPEYGEFKQEPEPGDPIGIRDIQSILMSATQTSLSHFHTAGMSTTSTATGVKPSAADAMNSLYTKNNTSMTFYTHVNVKDIRRHIVGANLGDFVRTVGCSSTAIPERENVWYEVLNVPMTNNILRIYINYKKMFNYGLTLNMLAREAFGDDCSWKVSPDFMGIIDVELSDGHMSMSTWLSRIDCRVCGTPDVLSCNSSTQRDRNTTVITKGTNILAAARTPGIDKTTITSNNITEVEKFLGIEAATNMLNDLVKSRIVSDFMTRTGTVLSFDKRSNEIKTKGLLTSMGFERPKDDIKNAVAQHTDAHTVQVYENIMTGTDPFQGFEVIKKEYTAKSDE